MGGCLVRGIKGERKVPSKEIRGKKVNEKDTTLRSR
jgi:hypothetical protein